MLKRLPTCEIPATVLGEQLAKFRMVCGVVTFSKAPMIIAIVITAVVSGAAGFVGGILVGRRNSNKVENTVSVAKAVASDLNKL